MSKTFKSPRKLNSLPEGTRITFSSDPSSLYSMKWLKLPSGKWTQHCDTFSTLRPYTSESLLARNNHESFTVLPSQQSKEN